MSSSLTDDDARFMKRALALALRGQGRVEPNPMVGCVVVRDGRVVGEGYHRRYGGPHAERHALRAAGTKARGADVYVTLEPCCHHGKTPPCVEALLEAQVGRVFAAMRDPFSRVRGRGVRQLRAAGIKVEVGLLESEARVLVAPYLKRLRVGQPWVILKWAQSLDGKIATHAGDSQWISGEQARRRAHRLRGRVDAVIVGVRTVITDDPMLNCRHGRPRRTATRVVLDPTLRTPPTCQLIRTAGELPTLIATGQAAARGARGRRLVRAGAEIAVLPSRRGRLDLERLLTILGQRGMTNVMVEGGGETIGRFLDAGLADEAMVFVSRRLIGGAEAIPATGGRGPAAIREAIRPVSTRVFHCGQDDVYELKLREP